MEMVNKSRTYKVAASGLLIAIGIAIPMFMPLRIVIEPASYTLASHVAIFIAMFISPGVAAAVVAGTTLGFAWAGFPPTVVARAASHIVFAVVGAIYLKRASEAAMKGWRLRVFSFVIAIIHGVSELAAVVAFTLLSGGAMNAAMFASFLVMVGAGTVVHSMVDLEIANVIRLRLKLKS